MRLLHAWDAHRRPGALGRRRRSQSRHNSRASLRQLLPLHRIPGDRRCDRVRRPDARGKGKLTMNEHARPLTLSERADELEEQVMQALNERIIAKSVLFRMADGRVEIDNGQALLAANPGKHFLMGADPRLLEMPEKHRLGDDAFI